MNKMYRINPLFENELPKPSTVMYSMKSYFEDFPNSCDTENAKTNVNVKRGGGGDNRPIKGSPVSTKQCRLNPSVHHGPDGVSDIERRQVTVLTQLQQLSVLLDKLSGKSGGKKRTSAQDHDVKRQKTESICDEELMEFEPDTVVLTEPIDFAVYQSKDSLASEIEMHFPLVIILGFDDPPPLSIFVLASLLRQRAAPDIRIGIRSFMHSSVCDDHLTKWKAQQQFNSVANDGVDISQSDAMINFIWKKEAHEKGPVLLRRGSNIEARSSLLFGELAIAKYLAKLANFYPLDGSSPAAAFLTLEYWLYSADGFAKPSYSEIRGNLLEEINGVLAKRHFLTGDRVTFADVIMWSILTQCGVKATRASILPLPANSKNWILRSSNMPFLRGFMPIRHTKYWLEKGDLILREQVRILCFAFDQENKEHKGAQDFDFWHWNQLQYRNPEVQLIRHDMKPPSPFIQAFLQSGEQVLIDIDGHDHGQIHDRLSRVLGKTKLVVEQEKLEKEATDNIANFGYKSLRQCMCEVQGQQPCSMVIDPPGYLTGRWRWNKTEM